MPKLKSRTLFPPGEHQLLLPEVGMKESLHGSFTEMVDAFAKIVARNPALAQKYHWPTDRTAQENFVDERNAIRLLKQGFPTFVDAAGSPEYGPGPDVKKNWRGLAAAVVAGSKSWSWMLSGDGYCVQRERALERAQVCLTCPHNDVKGGMVKYFLSVTAKALQAAAGVLRDVRGCQTPHDEKLGVCDVCSCPLPSKIWFPIEIIEKEMPAGVWPNLPDFCWLKKEKTNGSRT